MVPAWLAHLAEWSRYPPHLPISSVGVLGFIALGWSRLAVSIVDMGDAIARFPGG
jgi:hypothetical protein